MDIRKKLEEIFSIVLYVPTASIKDTTSPDNTPEWDSLNAIVLITEIEKAFTIRFTYDEAMRIHTFGDAVAFVQSKL